MNELNWVQLILKHLAQSGLGKDDNLSLETGYKLAYGHEIRSTGKNERTATMEFATDLAVLEMNQDGSMTPRVVVEGKIGSVTTHDAITYSHKASSHKAVFPYLRYGIMLGNRANYPLPGRLYRHGQNFDFMISFCRFKPTDDEIERFYNLIASEIEASRLTEKIIYESRRHNRDRYTLLQRRLVVQ